MNVYKSLQYTDQIRKKGNLYNMSAYASDAVKALDKVLKTCNETGVGLNNSCTGNNQNWNISFLGSTVMMQHAYTFRMLFMYDIQGSCEV